jgi:hypothetical protein
MKRYVLSMVLVAMLLPAFAVAREFERPEDTKWQMEMREREMELEQRKAEMDFARRKQELELQGYKQKLENLRKPKEHPGPVKLHKKDGPHPLLLLVLVVHILVAVWVYQDIRRRGSGSGIWIVIALLTGLLGTLVYAVVRLGNNEKKKA